MALFVGRLSPNVRTRDLEDFFGRFGKLKRCDNKGRFAFVTFEDERDAEDAVRESQGRELCGGHINVEWSRESGRRSENPGGDRERGGRGGGGRRDNNCFNCGRPGHIARECRSRGSRSGGGRRDGYRGRSRSRSPRGGSRSPRRRDSRSPRRARSPERREPERKSPGRDRSPERQQERTPERRRTPSPRGGSPPKPTNGHEGSPKK